MPNKIKQQCDLLPMAASMAIITKYYYGALSKMLEHLEIERYFTALYLIHKTNEKCTQQYLSDMLHVDKVSMVRIVDYLVKKGMIERIVNPDDRREHIVILTKKGEKIIPEINNAIINLNKIALKGIDKEANKIFWHAIESIMNNLKHLPINTVDIKIKK